MINGDVLQLVKRVIRRKTQTKQVNNLLKKHSPSNLVLPSHSFRRTDIVLGK